jgi:hypothetical protein
MAGDMAGRGVPGAAGMDRCGVGILPTTGRTGDGDQDGITTMAITTEAGADVTTAISTAALPTALTIPPASVRDR